MIAAPQRMMDVDVSDTPELSGGGGGPQSVPSRISVMLIEEAMAGGTPRRECPRDDQDIRSLAGVAKPGSVTVHDDGLGSPCVGGTLWRKYGFSIVISEGILYYALKLCYL